MVIFKVSNTLFLFFFFFQSSCTVDGKCIKSCMEAFSPYQAAQIIRRVNVYSWAGNTLNHSYVKSSLSLIDIIRHRDCFSQSVCISMTMLQSVPLNTGFFFFSHLMTSLNLELFSFSPCFHGGVVLLLLTDTGTMRIKVCLVAKIAPVSFKDCGKSDFSVVTHTCLEYISWRHAVWKPEKHWGCAPTVPSCLYELVTHSATNATRSQSQAQ